MIESLRAGFKKRGQSASSTSSSTSVDDSQNSDTGYACKLKISLLNEDGKLIQSGQEYSFTGMESFEKVKEIAENCYKNITSNGIKIGKMANQIVSTFEGLPLRKFMSRMKMAPSKTSIYVIANSTLKRKSDRITVSESESISDDSTDLPEFPKLQKRLNVTTFTSINFSEIELGDILDEGGDCPVYKGIWQHTSVAIKCFTRKNRQDAEIFKAAVMKEVDLHANIRHPNVVTFYGICENDNHVYMLMERMHSSLDKIIVEKAIKIDERKMLDIALKICRGIEYLHSRNIVHGDIKPPNVLINEDATVVKVTDFGLSRLKNTAGVTQVSKADGTAMFMAPEELLGNIRHNFQTDSWAVAATLTELFANQPFWSIPKGKDPRTYISKKMQKQEMSTAMQLVKKRNPSLFHIVEEGFSMVPEKRDSVSKIRQNIEDAIAALE